MDIIEAKSKKKKQKRKERLAKKSGEPISNKISNPKPARQNSNVGTPVKKTSKKNKTNKNKTNKNKSLKKENEMTYEMLTTIGKYKNIYKKNKKPLPFFELIEGDSGKAIENLFKDLFYRFKFLFTKLIYGISLVLLPFIKIPDLKNFFLCGVDPSCRDGSKASPLVRLILMNHFEPIRMLTTIGPFFGVAGGIFFIMNCGLLIHYELKVWAKAALISGLGSALTLFMIYQVLLLHPQLHGDLVKGSINYILWHGDENFGIFHSAVATILCSFVTAPIMLLGLIHLPAIIFLIYFIGSAYPDYFDVDKFSKSFMKTDNIDFRDNIIYALGVLISMVFVGETFRCLSEHIETGPVLSSINYLLETALYNGSIVFMLVISVFFINESINTIDTIKDSIDTEFSANLETTNGLSSEPLTDKIQSVAGLFGGVPAGIAAVPIKETSEIIRGEVSELAKTLEDIKTQAQVTRAAEGIGSLTSAATQASKAVTSAASDVKSAATGASQAVTSAASGATNAATQASKAVTSAASDVKSAATGASQAVTSAASDVKGAATGASQAVTSAASGATNAATAATNAASNIASKSNNAVANLASETINAAAKLKK